MRLLLSCIDEFQVLCEGWLVNMNPCPGRVTSRVMAEVGADKGQEERQGSWGDRARGTCTPSALTDRGGPF